ncbi:hypothetical protein B0H67DRAFT_644939 [Lasiosphaeris hirsuta]|uniref:SRR1-like domain-containing protein n=1 Tax=Lasiosphaeris hirsuta TaxID=260670 RepID=A0AA40AG03_9PEZI|nr:hypothetical protein B0H67DRAFT_644939 [Lasiosphaeris hirsuta]
MEKVEIPPIKKVIAIASGSVIFNSLADPDYYTEPEFSEHDTSKCFIQNAIVLTLRDIFADKLGRSGRATAPSDVSCYVQDIMYTAVDTEILGGEGITVVEHPHGFLEMDDQTAVFCNSPGFPMREITADIARPAIMIWNSSIWLGDLLDARVEAMTKDYLAIPFPADDMKWDWPLFDSDTTIYIRKPTT